MLFDDELKKLTYISEIGNPYPSPDKDVGI